MTVFDKGVFLDGCGLKFDREVILNQDAVYLFYLNHIDWFHDVFLDLNAEGFSYGVLSNGYFYKIGVKSNRIERIVISSEKEIKKRVKAVIAYDGTEFSGFQVQKKDRSVQGEIEKILSECHNQETKIHGASRTDAGVHAKRQVIHFDTDKKDTIDKWKYYFNRRLPKDIFVKSVEFVHPLFHSRFDVLRKEYRYLINIGEYNPLKRNYEWNVSNLDLDILSKELHSIIGCFDFTSFSKGEKDSKIRTIYNAYIIRHGDTIELIFEGDGFLRYMIRLMVFALVKISKKELRASMTDIINLKSRKYSTHLAPACGLYLYDVEYSK